MSKNGFRICFLACFLVAIPLTVARAYRTNKKSSTAPPITTQDSAEVPQGLLFELRHFGFIPAETEITAGKYTLLLQNRSGGKDLKFTLERENQGRVAASPEHHRDWSAKLQLAPGTYILSEVDHPEWKAVIRVTPR